MKNRKLHILIFTIALMFFSTSIVFASGIGGNSGKTRVINETTIQFRAEFDKYGYNGFEFVKDYHQGQYGIYSPVKSGDTQPYKTLRVYLKENQQTSLGRNGEHLVGNTWWSQQSGLPDYNLKKGSIDPSKWGPEAYNGDNTGTFRMENYSPAKYYEFRYIGYTKDGVVVDNPYFPADNSRGKRPDTKNWYTFNDMKKYYPSLNHIPTYLNDKPDTAKKTFETWFNTTELGMYFKEKAQEKGAKAGEEWMYWNERLAILSDIDDGAAILKGWHYSSGMWYQTFAVPKAPQNNIAVTKLELVDPEKEDEVIIAIYRTLDETDIFNVNKMKIRYINNEGAIQKGKEYKIKAEVVYHSKNEDGSLGRPTQLGTIQVDRHYAYDNNVGKYNVFNKEEKMSNGEGLVSYDKPYVLQSGETANFEWKFKVPDNIQNKGSIYVKVPPEYVSVADNLIRADDWLSIVYTIEKNDIGFVAPVELFNSTGSKVNYVYPNEAHTVKFNIKHFLGQIPIGLDPVDNPKTTIDVVITDGNNNVIRSATLRSDEILNPNSQISMEVKNIATPTTMIKACATINKVHKEKGLNSNPQNDTICQIFAQAKNYAIKELKINPHYINVPDGANATQQVLNFRFVVAHEGQSGYGDNPIVVIRQGGKEIKRATVSVPAGKQITEVWPISVNLKFGENDFEVEVNPAPRQIQEFRSTGEDPYADNVKKDSVVVRRNPKCIECEVGVRTRNTWSEIFDMHEHIAKRVYYTCCRTSKNGSVSCSTCSRCETISDRYWIEIKNFYEEYKITNVYFRSKWTKDTKGGDGWVDLLTSEGKIKAGYGFELKIVTKYETNRGSIPPVPNTWRNDCSYLSRYPGIGYVTNPDIISLKMPYFDGFGNNVCYILNAENPRGSWDNSTKEFQLPYRDSFNVKSERKIYINENAKPGVQQLQIVTQKFDGYDPDAPYDVSNKRTLQDCKTVKFTILPNDDLKTHIVQ